MANLLSKYESITDWLESYSLLFSWIYFNVTPSEPDNVTINSVQNERELESYIDGSRRVEFLFAINLTKEFDIGTSDINLQAVQEFENLAEWIELQDSLANYPDFGDNVTIESVEVLETTPSVTVDNQNQVAKYQGQFKITYVERR